MSQPQSLRVDKVLSDLKNVFARIAGITVDQVEVDVTLLELGVDSLTMIQATQTIQSTLGVKIPFRLLVEDNPTLKGLAAYVESQMPAEELQPKVAVEVSNFSSRGVGDMSSEHPSVKLMVHEVAKTVSTQSSNGQKEGTAPDTALSRIIAQQLGIMAEQLELLRRGHANGKRISTLATAPAPAPREIHAPSVSVESRPAIAAVDQQPATPVQSSSETYVPYKPSRAGSAGGLNSRQQQHLDALIERFCKRTAKSKQQAQDRRLILADSRTSAGFRLLWKEMLYTLVAERASGARFWDIDGNEYVDIAMGYGALLFGHTPPSIEGLQTHFNHGIQMGLISHSVGQAAELVRDLTGVERVSFCNSGTEAVMIALRLARTVTGRSKIAFFEGSYHGFFDEVLVRPSATLDGDTCMAPIAPGITSSSADNVLVLEYGDPKSLEILSKHAHELAAVLVEPVQSRRPDLQPVEFLRELRKLTRESGTALIFDEVITGFRVHPGGVQALFGIKADLVTYGKGIGAGVPVAVVAGKAAYIDPIDGGQWNYGDKSFPCAERTYVAGTYFMHPVTMSAVCSALTQLKQAGPQLQERLNARTAEFAVTLNSYFEHEQVPIRVVHFGSLFRFVFSEEIKLADVFFYHLLEKGVYTWEGRNCFLSTAHTDDDINKVISAVKEAASEMRAGGFIPERTPTDKHTEEALGKLLGTDELPASEARLIPTTIAQKELWILTQLGQDASRAYNESVTMHLRGPLDLPAMQRAIRKLIVRHEALRITFSSDGEFQLISPDVSVDLPVIDFSNEDPATREATVAEWLENQAQQVFDLEKGPLVHFGLAKFEEKYHLLVLTLHHIITDGWSNGVLIHDIGVLYTTECQGEQNPLPPVMGFSEYAELQAREQQSTEMESAQQYWLEQFSEPVPPLELPSDRLRPPLQTYTGSRQRAVIENSLLKQLRTVSGKHGSTLFVSLLAAFQLLLHRLSNQDDLVVGISAAGQPHAGDNSLVGYCTNLLPLRSRISENPPFNSYLAGVKKTVFDAYDHQIYPFGKLIRELRIERDPSRPPLVSVIFNMDTKLDDAPSIPDLEVSVASNLPRVAKFDLNLNISQTANELLLDWEYNTDLFEPETIERWHDHFRTVLESIVSAPEQTVFTMPLMRSSAVHRQAQQSHKQHDLIHRLFDSQAARTPEAVALVYEGESLTFTQLNARSNQLAHYLRTLGVGAETLVGVCLDRSIEMVVTLLGVLKAGGAYLPLDPSYPRERLSFMLADAQAPLLLTQDTLLQGLPKYEGKIVCLDLDWDLITRFPTGAPETRVNGDNLAYIVYTSGSTGQPKGVMVTHANVTRLFTATNHWFHFNERDVWTFFHSYAFDFSVWELWGALFYGGRLVVVPYWVSRSPEVFYELLRREQVTILNQTPSAFRQLIQAEEAGTGASELALRLVIFGGEALDLQMLQPWIERHGDAHPQLVNMYGISETTVHVTYRPLKASDILSGSGSVIGGPIPDLSVNLLNPYLQPSPVGVTGEMFIGGEGVARGYLHRPELTAERFIPDPFAAQPGARLYRSGDIARTLPNGDVEYLGRMDHQVKVRGFRIELGEIESVLRRHAAIREALVSMREDKSGEKRLVAYLIGEERAVPDSLRGYLKENLPEYMIPSAMIWLEAFPLTASGKIDRKALPAPGTARPDLHELYVPPRTPTEELMSAIWSKVLGVYPVGIHDNFFALGGDSIRGIQILGDVRARGLQHFELTDLFRYPTINECSQLLAKKEIDPSSVFHTQPFSLISEADRDKLPPGIEDAYPLTMLQSGMLYHMTLTPEASVYHNVNSLRVRGPFNLEAMQEAQQHIATRQPVLRTSFDFGTYSEPLQLVHKSAFLPVEVEDLRGLSESGQLVVIDNYVETEKRNFFDPSKPPLIRIKIHRLKDDEFQWTLTDFHPVIDGWAVAVMISEISDNYATLLNGGTLSDEAPLPVTFRDYVNLEMSIVRDQKVKNHLVQMLSDSTLARLPRWPVKYELTNELEIRSMIFEIPEEILTGLQQLVRSEAIPLHYLLLAAHMKVMSLLTGQSDITAGLVMDGRLEEPGGEQVLGLYLNTMPYRLKLSPGTWIDLAQKVFAGVLSLLSYRRFPLAALQHEFGGAPLFENMFYFIDFHNLHATSLVSPLKLVKGTHSFNNTHFPFQAMFSLDRAARSDESSLNLRLDFDAGQFHPKQLEAIAIYYREALRRIASNPSGQHQNASLLSEDEHREMLKWNETSTGVQQPASIQQLFDAQAELTPDAVALICEDRQLTFRQLKTRANELANYLKQQGVGAEKIVGICMDRSLDSVLALLGVLKAGGAYLPLDPAYPRERISFMLSDAQPVLVLTQQHRRDVIIEHEVAVVCIDTDWEQIAAYGDESPMTDSSLESLCYVIYTSGSTGQPKGVLNLQRGAINRLRWMWEQYPFAAGEICCQKTSLNFVDSVWEIFGPLLKGVPSVVIPDEIVKDTVSLVEMLSRKGVTRITVVPSLMRMILDLDMDLQAQLSMLKYWTTSGEVLTEELLETFVKRLPEAVLLNLYGSSEVAADVTSWEMGQQNDSATVSIGRPIANTQIYLLNADLQLVPVGVAGELYVSGAGLARGYHERPELTAERFIPSPFGPAGARLYRSGDLARYRPNGAIDYLGRTDHQVKVRGFRIELGEVEAVLREHDAVNEAVVMVREDIPGDKRLVAYVVPADPPRDITGELRSYMKAKVPDYVIPAAFVQLEEFKLTGSGKVDRQALPVPDQSRPTLQEAFVAPRNELEETIAQIWREVLGMERVGIHDDFFEIGGNSLLAMQIIAKVSNTFDVYLPLHHLFDTPTIAGLALNVETATSGKMQLS